VALSLKNQTYKEKQKISLIIQSKLNKNIIYIYTKKFSLQR